MKDDNPCRPIPLLRVPGGWSPIHFPSPLEMKLHLQLALLLALAAFGQAQFDFMDEDDDESGESGESGESEESGESDEVRSAVYCSI